MYDHEKMNAILSATELKTRKLRVGQMTQKIKALAAKSDDLSSMPGTHKKTGQSCPWPPHAVAWTHTNSCKN